MRLAVVVLLGACSFDHGRVGGTTDDGGPGDGDGGGDALTVSSPRKLVFDNSASTIDFGSFPVLVALDATKIDYAAVADPKTDLRFEYATPGPLMGNNLAFEVERWNPAGESIVWIRVPEILAGSTNTAVLMHFGPTAGGSSSGSATWTNWELVNHMATGLTNSAGAYTPTAINLTFAEGQFGEATVFSGTGDNRVQFANAGALFDAWTEYFLSFWIYANYNSAADVVGGRKVMDKGTSIELGRLYASATNIIFQLDEHFTGSNNDIYLTTVIQPKTWTNIAVVFDGYGTGIARNGVAGGYFDLTSNQQTLQPSNQAFRLGDNGTPFNGMLDELRIERRSRSLDFVYAQYLIGKRQFVTFTDP